MEHAPTRTKLNPEKNFQQTDERYAEKYAHDAVLSFAN